jgi:hypothetical protein
MLNIFFVSRFSSKGIQSFEVEILSDILENMLTGKTKKKGYFPLNKPFLG